MSTLWEDVKNAIVDGYVFASDKAEELTHIGKAKVEILKLNRQIAQTMTEIGGRVYDMFDKDHQDDVPTDEMVRGFVESIQAFQADIEKRENEIEQAKAAREVKTAE